GHHAGSLLLRDDSIAAELVVEAAVAGTRLQACGRRGRYPSRRDCVRRPVYHDGPWVAEGRAQVASAAGAVVLLVPGQVTGAEGGIARVLARHHDRTGIPGLAEDGRRMLVVVSGDVAEPGARADLDAVEILAKD